MRLVAETVGGQVSCTGIAGAGFSVMFSYPKLSSVCVVDFCIG